MKSDFRPICGYISEMVEGRWVHYLRHFTSTIQFLKQNGKLPVLPTEQMVWPTWALLQIALVS